MHLKCRVEPCSTAAVTPRDHGGAGRGRGLADLIQTTTHDAVRLDGAYHTPPRPGAAGLALDALCLLHGTGGSFYSSPLFGFLAERLLELGVGVLRANTRGHDLISTASTTQGPRRQGAAYEVVE